MCGQEKSVPRFFGNSPSPNQIPTAVFQRCSDIVQSATFIPDLPEMPILLEGYGKGACWAKEDCAREMPVEMPKFWKLNIDIVVWRNIREAHHQSVPCHAAEFLQCDWELGEG